MLRPGKTYSLYSAAFMERFGIPHSDLDGSYFLKCSITGTPCSVCLGPKQSRTCEYGVLSVQGLTGTKSKLFELMIDELERIDLFNRVVSNTGKLPWGTRPLAGKSAKDVSDDDFLDIYYNFPNDREIKISDSEISDRVQLSEKERAIFQGYPQYKVWDEHRVECAQGKHGKLAARCSIEDAAWGYYLQIGEDASHVRERLRLAYFDYLLKKNSHNSEFCAKVMDLIKNTESADDE